MTSANAEDNILATRREREDGGCAGSEREKKRVLLPYVRGKAKEKEQTRENESLLWVTPAHPFERQKGREKFIL